MMAAQRSTPRLIDRLPPVRGRIAENVALAPLTWFRVGGPAEIMFRPADPEDLAQFLAALPGEVPVTVLGVASNLLVRDGGIPGVVIRLGRGFAGIEVSGETVRVGSGALDLNLALTCRDAGLGGLEFFSGIPGTIGGALRMNAGAYGGDTKDRLRHAVALDRSGHRHTVDAAALGLSYRHCDAPADWIFTEAVFAGEREDPAVIGRRIAEIQAAREASQPIRARTGGSTFANPPGHKAWELIDQVGGRGLRRGGAQISEKHCNFLINTGDATASDLEGLGEEIRRLVHAATGIRLEWEIKRVGVPLSGPAAVSGTGEVAP